MKDAGYQYVNIDDCGQVGRTFLRRPFLADPQLFPHGMKAGGDNGQSLGPNFGGVYSYAGSKTCAGRARGARSRIFRRYPIRCVGGASLT